MPYGCVALQARCASPTMRAVDCRNDVLMTVAASCFRSFSFPFPDLNRVRESPRGKCQRVKKAVGCLGCIFADQIGRSVTVIATSSRTVPRFQPPVILVLHHMTVR